jgi:hypothetical protein
VYEALAKRHPKSRCRGRRGTPAVEPRSRSGASPPGDRQHRRIPFRDHRAGGSSLYPALAQRVTNVEVLRIHLSIGPTETAHFQTWHDNPLTDPTNGLVFPNLNKSPFGGEDFQTINLIMPTPTEFISSNLPACSIIRPTATQGAATAAVNALTADGLFIGQSQMFFSTLQDLATRADSAQRGC